MNSQNKKILLGAGIITGLIVLAAGSAFLFKKVKEAKQRKALEDPNINKGTAEDLATNYGQVIGSIVYPKGSYAWVRSTAVVNDPQGIFIDFNQTNQLWKINSPSEVGLVKQSVTGEDGKTWYKIEPYNKPKGIFPYRGYATDSKFIKEAFVRSDVVTFKNK
jgi:hypothetical protein